MVNNFEQHSILVQALGSHQHTLQSFKITFLIRNLDQNKIKMRYFWKSYNSVLGAGFGDALTTHFAVI